jgi:hypothetical protein
MRRRTNLSTVLLMGAATLLIALALGNGMGSRVVSQVAERIPQFAASSTPAPEATATDAQAGTAWKRTQVMAVATDPGFPDPRVTPAPPPPPPPRRVTPSPSPSPTSAHQRQPYTSPPLPIPIVSHYPGETSTDPEPTDSAETAAPTP